MGGEIYRAGGPFEVPGVCVQPGVAGGGVSSGSENST